MVASIGHVSASFEGQVEDAIDRKEFESAFLDRLESLSPKRREVVELRLGLTGRSPMSFAEVGRYLGKTRSGVSNLYHSGVRDIFTWRRGGKFMKTFEDYGHVTGFSHPGARTDPAYDDALYKALENWARSR